MDGLGYFNRIMVYKGINPPESLRPQAGDDNKALRIVTQGFGLANYYHIIGEEEKSVAMLKEVIGDRRCQPLVQRLWMPGRACRYQAAWDSDLRGKDGSINGISAEI